MSQIHETIFLMFYRALGPESYVSGLTIFVASWSPFIIVGLALMYEIFIRTDNDTIRAMMRIYIPPFLVLGFTELVKQYFPAGRPFALLEIPPSIIVSDPFGSFPSSHAAFFSALAMTMYFCNPRLGKWFFGAAGAIGLARIGAGVHWPIDILGGFAIGVALGYLIEKTMLLFWESRAPKC